MVSLAVALIRCPDYHSDQVYAALERGVELLGGLDRFVTPGERILLKPNILAGDPPERAVTTHPAVLEACIQLFQHGGATVSFGDSPGFESIPRSMARSGLQEVGLRTGAAVADFASSNPISNPTGLLVDQFPIVRAVHECDGVINLPKMKTHQFTRITGAVKNLFGCIPGQRKGLYHLQFQDVMDFSTMLVSVALCVRPRLHILDGILAMQGNGPRGGEPRMMHLLALSEDPVALDAAFCRIINLDPSYVPTNTMGQRMGLGSYLPDAIEYVGDPLDSFICSDFQVARKPVYNNATYAFFNWIKSLVLSKPVIDPAKCTRCGACVQACPVPGKALTFQDRDLPPIYDYVKCIRFYCCHETCPSRAIHKKIPFLARLLPFE